MECIGEGPRASIPLFLAYVFERTESVHGMRALILQ